MVKITVLGSGSWGTGLSRVLLDNDHAVTMWGIDEKQITHFKQTGKNVNFMSDHILDGKIDFTCDINQALRGAQIVVNTVPTQHVAETLSRIASFERQAVFVNAAKGLEVGSLHRISQIVKQYFPDMPYAVISGPSHAEEVVKRLPTTVVVASEQTELSMQIQDIFMTPYFRVYGHTDVIGVELSAALKNVIAIGAGICDGLGYGDNALAALMTRGIAEIKRLGHAMGALVDTFDGLAGIGDLIVTCMSNHSRNRRCGQLIGRGYAREEAVKKVGQAVEGIHTVVAAEQLRKLQKVDMPIVEQLYGILYEGNNARDAVEQLMMRQKKMEREILD